METIKEEIFAKVTATLPQLKVLGIDEDLTNKEVKVYDIDKFNGIGGLCSRIVIDNKLEWPREKGINADYIIPTKCLSFSKIKADSLKGKYAILKEDFIPESEHFETGLWNLKKGTRVYVKGNEGDGTCYIEYIEAGFEIDFNKLDFNHKQ